MKTVPKTAPRVGLNGVPLLCNGDRMSQAEFHRRYADYPEDEKFELIGGIVYIASPLRYGHGRPHQLVSMVLGVYQSKTPGVDAYDNVTTILGEDSEVQPDLSLRILPAYGGRTRDTEDEYIAGGPELATELAYSSRAIDLHQKKEDYRRAGVMEYLVVSLEEQKLHWFHFQTESLILPDKKGIYRSSVFPGLWIDARALFASDSARLLRLVLQGTRSREHAAFVRQLRNARRT
jgi:hypothetical protein